jgi:hypothetical protein
VHQDDVVHGRRNTINQNPEGKVEKKDADNRFLSLPVKESGLQV